MFTSQPNHQAMLCEFLTGGSHEKMLCLDDSLSILRLYRDELSEEGYKVILAKEGQEGLMKFSKESPDVVVMDIRMPLIVKKGVSIRGPSMTAFLTRYLVRGTQKIPSFTSRVAGNLKVPPRVKRISVESRQGHHGSAFPDLNNITPNLLEWSMKRYSRKVPI